MAPDLIENVLVFYDDHASDEELREVLEAVRLLPEDAREILMLAGRKELTYQEMAARFGYTVGTVQSRLSRARANLARRLAAMKKPMGRKLQTRSAGARRTRPSERGGNEPHSPA